MKTVTAAIIHQDGKVLLTRRGQGEKLAGMWEFPGGKVEGGETLAECLVRELREELGIETSVGKVIAESIFTYDHGSIRLVAMETKITTGRPTLTVHDRAEWVDPDDLSNYHLAPADVPIAETVRGLLRGPMGTVISPE